MCKLIVFTSIKKQLNEKLLNFGLRLNREVVNKIILFTTSQLYHFTM